MKAKRLDHEGLLKRHGIQFEEFERTGLEWEHLEEIGLHHEADSQDLQTVGRYVSERLQPIPSVHSLKVRVKNPEHLIAKIIRKKLEKPDLDFNVDSYQHLITDLIGLRALHLFKEDWHAIHDFVLNTWDLHEQPIAYVRKGDPDTLLKNFETADCKVTVHPFGYRSVHYLLELKPDKRTYLAELQVRTIFEEGWSEIDHRVRYPRQSDDLYLADFLGIFNRLSGSADEMGSFIKTLSRFAIDQAGQIAERDRQIAQKEAELKKAVSELKISRGEKQKLEKQIEELRQTSRPAGGAHSLSSSALGTDPSFASSAYGLLGQLPPSTLDAYSAAKEAAQALSMMGTVVRSCVMCGAKFSVAPSGALANNILDNFCPSCQVNPLGPGR